MHLDSLSTNPPLFVQLHFLGMARNSTTERFPVLETRNPATGEFYVIQVRRFTKILMHKSCEIFGQIASLPCDFRKKSFVLFSIFYDYLWTYFFSEYGRDWTTHELQFSPWFDCHRLLRHSIGRKHPDVLLLDPSISTIDNNWRPKMTRATHRINSIYMLTAISPFFHLFLALNWFSPSALLPLPPLRSPTLCI